MGNGQAVHITPFSVKYHYSEDENDICLRFFKNMDDLFTWVSRVYAFADCDDSIQIDKITCGDETIHYVGWLPDMMYKYCNEKGEIVWGANFPAWEH